MRTPGELARQIRLRTLEMVHRVRASHLGGCLSVTDILAVLYSGILKIDPRDPENPGRDRLVLSKGHSCAALYATLAECQFFPLEMLERFYQDGSLLQGHVCHHLPGIEVSTGSLGHGLGLALGMALAGRGPSGFRAFAVLGDGECDEGSVWEAALLAGHLKLDNLVVIVDYNKIQSLGNTDAVLSLEPFDAKWNSFGWATRVINGHDLEQLQEALTALPLERGRPTCLIAHTVKGRGVDFAENSLDWHYFSPDAEQYRDARAQLEAV